MNASWIQHLLGSSARDRTRRLWILGVVLLAVTLAVPAAGLESSQYAALAAGIQAFGVLVALAFASETLTSDSRERRVDRVLALHQEFTSGEIAEARQRLWALLRTKGASGKFKRSTLDELRSNPDLTCQGDPSFVPFQDAMLLVWFFERAYAAHIGRAVDDHLLASLVGRHAGWWHLALTAGSTQGHSALGDLSDWATSYAQAQPASDELFIGWGTARQRDFDLTPAEIASLSVASLGPS